MKSKYEKPLLEMVKFEAVDELMGNAGAGDITVSEGTGGDGWDPIPED